MNFGSIQISMCYRKGVLDLANANVYQLRMLVAKDVISEAEKAEVEKNLKAGAAVPQIPIRFHTVFQYADGDMSDGIDAGAMAAVEILTGPAKGRLLEVPLEVIRLDDLEED